MKLAKPQCNHNSRFVAAIVGCFPVASSGHRAERAAGRQQGLTLVELLVAMLISAFILIGLVQIFATNRATYQADEGLARLQENGRFAVDFLSRDIRMAGNMGCLGKIPADQQEKVWNYLNNPTAPAFSFISGINGFEAPGTAPGASYALPVIYPAVNVTTTVPALDPLIGGAIAGTDALTVRYMDGETIPLVPNPAAGNAYHDATQVFSAATNTLSQGDIVMVTNCMQVAIFEITNTPSGVAPMSIVHETGGALGNSCATWGAGGCKGYDNAFRAGSQIAALRSRFYFVARAPRGTSPEVGPALWRRDANVAAATELVEGIENMQILYGIDSNPQDDTGRNGRSADRYLPANLVTDWTRVISVRIGLLVSTGNTAGKADTSQDTSTYSVAGVTINVAGAASSPADNLRRRRVFTTTIGLRNL